jgi:hypothetical protein
MPRLPQNEIREALRTPTRRLRVRKASDGPNSSSATYPSGGVPDPPTQRFARSADNLSDWSRNRTLTCGFTVKITAALR